MSLIREIKTMWKPEVYHGAGKDRYFEGWYFKVIDRDEKNRIAVIPGISQGEDGHSFIQVLDEGTPHYYRFDTSEFSCRAGAFDVTIAENSFTLNRIALNIGDHVRGELRFHGMVPWPVTPLSPGAMGPYAFAPFMECYHGVLSMNHTVSGSLVLNGRPVDFTGGKGYVEKDWGSSFPSAWIWMQTNHFDEEASLSASIAKIPWRGSFFTGFIIGLWHGRRLHRFATYTGARITELSTRGERVSVSLEKGKHRLELSAEKAGGGELRSPVMGEMKGKLSESLSSRVAVSFFERRELLFRGEGRNAGLEVAGDTMELLEGLGFK